MNIIKRENVLRYIACLCAFAIGIGAVFFTGSSMKETYADDLIDPSSTINLTGDKYEINLKAYERGTRTIEKGPNKTGVTIIYDDDTWTYIDEYTTASENSINLSTVEIASDKAIRITGLYIAPGYEAILMDREAQEEKKGQEGYTYIVNGEGRNTSCHTTRILGPINIKGMSYSKFIETLSKDKKNVDIDVSGDFDITDDIMIGMIKSQKDNIIEHYKGETEIKDTKIDNTEITIGMLADFIEKSYKRSNVLNEKYKNVDSEYWGDSYDLAQDVGMREYNTRDYLSKVSGSIKLENDTDDERNDVKIYNLRKIQVKKVSQKEGVYLMKGLYNVLNEENRHSNREEDPEFEGVFEYLSPAMDETYNRMDLKKDRTSLKTNGHVNSIMVVGNYKVEITRNNYSSWNDFWGASPKKEYIVIQGAKGKITCITNFWENENDGDCLNEIVNIRIMPRIDDEFNQDENTTDDSWDNAFYFTNESGGVEKTKKNIKDYEKFVKRYDMEERTQEASVTAYTRANFKGQYLRFYMGELNNLGDDKEIEEIGSLEVAPNTRVIFFNKEDCEIDPNPANKDKIVIDGPAYIPDLEEYFHRAYLENGKLTYNKFDAKAFLIQYSRNTYKGVSLYNYKNGVGTFQTEGVDKLNQRLDIEDYVPESVTIRGNYFVKFHDSNGKVIKTVIGPVKNYNIQSDEFYSAKDNFIKSNTNINRTTIIDVGTGNETVKEGYRFLDEFKRQIKYIATNYVLQYYLPYKQSGRDIQNKKDDLQKSWENYFGNEYGIGNQFVEKLKTFMIEVERLIDKGYENGITNPEQYGITTVVGSANAIGFDLDATSELGQLATKYNEDADKIYESIGEETATVMSPEYDKWNGATMLIGELTQRDKKSRSLENTDGIVLYQNTNYNGGAQSAEDIWSHFSGDSNIDLTKGIAPYIEVEPNNIHSIRIVGSLAGNYEITINAKTKDNTTITKTTRYNISDLDSFFGQTGLTLNSITLHQVEDKELKTLLDASKKTGSYIEISDFKTIQTTENIQKKKKDSSTTYGLDNSEVDTIERTVYIASLEDIIKEIEQKISTNNTAKEFARLDYVYKYDPADTTKEDLVGVKVTRNIGGVNKDNVKLEGKDKTKIETYTDIIGQSKKDISRQVEFKLNLLSALEVLNDQKITLSDEFSYTDDAREVIITDHGYLDKTEGVSQKLLEKQIEMIDTSLYNKETSDDGTILTKILNNGTTYQDSIVKFSVICSDKSGKANAKVEIVKDVYEDTVNNKEYKFELSENTDITLEGKKVNGDFNLLKNGGEITAKVLLNISSKDNEQTEWTSLANNVEYVMRIYLPETNSISEVTLAGNSVVSRIYNDAMEVPTMLVKEGNQTIEYATEKDNDRILYVPICYKQEGTTKTSFLLEQLGMKAAISGQKVRISY